MQPPDPSISRLLELEAAHLVAAVLDSQPKSRDQRGPGATDGMHDFDVNLPGGDVIALEVTTAANRTRIGTIAAFGKLRDAEFPSLTHGWGLTGRHPDAGERGPRINDLIQHGDDLLSRLEIAGVAAFDVEHPGRYPVVEDPDAMPAIQRLRELGVFAGMAMTQVSTVPVPAGWYVEITCATIADLAFTQVTC
jgi:hypothetical protein